VNPFKGPGVALIAFVVLFVLSRVSSVSKLVLVASVAIVTLCAITLVASARRRHQDRRVALGRAISADRRVDRPPLDPYKAQPGPWRPEPGTSPEDRDLETARCTAPCTRTSTLLDGERRAGSACGQGRPVPVPARAISGRCRGVERLSLFHRLPGGHRRRHLV